MKRLVISAFFFLLIGSISQAQSPWSIGLGGNPFLYWYYNRTDEMYLKQDFKIHYPDSFKPNGWQIGIPIQYQYSDRFFFQTALEYSTQTMKYEQIFPFDFRNDSSISNSRMNYLKVPLLIGFKHNFNLTNNYLYAMVGPQLLFLSSYKSIRVSYIEYRNNIHTVIEQNNSFSILDKTIDSMMETGAYRTNFNKWPYKRFVIGCVAELGVNIRLADKYRMFAGIRGDADLSGIDNLNSTRGAGDEEYNSWELGVRHHLRYNGGKKRSHTYQFRVGLHAGILYELR